MAEQVEVGNIGGEGVASEVTLTSLLAVTTAMAKKAGIDPKDVNKKLKALSQATEDTVKISSKNRDSIKKNTKAIDNSTSAVNKFGRSLAGTLASAFGALAGSAVGLTKTLLNGQNQLRDFAQHMPIVGEHLGDLVGVLDDSFDTFKGLASTGAAFNNSITDMRIAAAGTHLQLGVFAEMVSQNSSKLAAFGGTATQGAMQLSKMHKQMGAQRLELMNAGLTQLEVNEALIEYNHLTRAGSRQRRMDDKGLKEQSNAAASYTKHLLTLAKLTGEDVKSLQEKNAAASQSLAFQMKMATMEEDEKKKLMVNLATIQANGGTAAVQAFQAEFLGMPPLTQAAQNYVALNTEGYNLIKASIDDVYNQSLTTKANEAKQALLGVGLMQTNHDMAVNLGTQVAAMGAGMDGIAGLDMQSLLTDQATNIAGYTTEAGEFNRAAALANYTQATAETLAQTSVVDSLNVLKITVGEIQAELETNVKSPLILASGDAVAAITAQISKIPDTALFKTAMSTAKTQIESFGAAMGTLINSLEQAGSDPLALTKTAFQTGAKAIMDGMKDLMLGQVITSGPQTGQREGGLMESTFAPIFKSAGTTIINGLKSLFTDNPLVVAGVVVAIAGLFALPALGAALVAGIGSMFGGAAIASAMKNGIGGMFGKAKPPAGTNRDPRTGRYTSQANGAGGTAGKLGRGLLRRAPGIGLALGAYDIGSTLMDDNLSGSEKQQAVVETGGGMGGAVAGAYGGAAAGALLGSVVPLLGTAIGGALGGVIGGAAGWWAGSTAAGAANKALTATNVTATSAPPAGASIATQLTEAQVALMERVSAIDFKDFTSGVARLNTNKLSNIADLDFSSFATGLKTFAEIPNLKTQFDTVNSLDATAVISYTSAMEELVEVLGKVNEVLAEDNSGLFGGGTGKAAADLLGSIGSSTSGSAATMQQLNTTMQIIATTLSRMEILDGAVVKNTNRISGSNIAIGGVSNLPQ